MFGFDVGAMVDKFFIVETERLKTTNKELYRLLKSHDTRRLMLDQTKQAIIILVSRNLNNKQKPITEKRIQKWVKDCFELYRSTAVNKSLKVYETAATKTAKGKIIQKQNDLELASRGNFQSDMFHELEGHVHEVNDREVAQSQGKKIILSK